MKALLVVSAVLLSTALLLVGHGMQLTLLPLRAAGLGMPESLVAISASCYFAGFVVGCIGVPRVIARVGHIRSFAVLTAVMIISLLTLEMMAAWPVWLALRFITGVGVSSLYAVIESWLNSQALPATRGRILAAYTFITLAAMASGQMLLTVGPVMSATPFMLASIFMAFAILPVGLTKGMVPSPPEVTKIDFLKLFFRSKTAFTGALLSGVVAGSFWSLGAVFASAYSESQADISLFISIAILGGALAQYPIGLFSDKVDRRLVLVVLCVGTAITSAALALSVHAPWFLVTAFAFGATALPIYGVSLATAADVTDQQEFVEIGTSVLLLNAIGAMIAPIFFGQLMQMIAATSLYWAISIVTSMSALLLYRLSRQPRDVAVSDQTHFAPAVMEASPGSFELDPRATFEDDDGEVTSHDKN